MVRHYQHLDIEKVVWIVGWVEIENVVWIVGRTFVEDTCPFVVVCLLTFAVLLLV